MAERMRKRGMFSAVWWSRWPAQRLKTPTRVRKVEQAAPGVCLVNRHEGNSSFSLRSIKEQGVSRETVDFVANRSCLFTDVALGLLAPRCLRFLTSRHANLFGKSLREQPIGKECHSTHQTPTPACHSFLTRRTTLQTL
jgi:hypothetical protein